MRLLPGLALLACLGAAEAAPSPPQQEAPERHIDNGALYLGPAGALLEQDYFNAPSPRSGITRIFPCRFHLRTAVGTTRLAQSCD